MNESLIEEQNGNFANTVLGAVPSVVYNEDCMLGMKRYPDKFFDLAICDPPYGLDIASGNIGYSKHEAKAWDNNFAYREWLDELFRVSKAQVIWGFNHYLEHLPSTKSFLVWNKHQNGHFAECEIAWCSVGRARIYDRPYQKDIGNKIHPTQKPVPLYEFTLQNYLPEGGSKIIDTMVGSGSSRIACHKAGLEYVGYEIDTDYYGKQEARFKEFVSQLRMF